MKPMIRTILAFGAGIAVIVGAYRMAGPATVAPPLGVAVERFGNSQIVPDEYIAVRQPGASANAVIEGVSQTALDSRAGIVLLTARAGLPVQSLVNARVFASIEPNRIWYISEPAPDAALWAPSAVLDDPLIGQQYQHDMLRTGAAYDLIPTGGQGVGICIVDTGVGPHEDLDAVIVARESFVNDNGLDDYGHGTHVAGIAAAIANNHRGGAGIGHGAQILSAKVLSGGYGSTGTIIRGNAWCRDQGARVINMSLGGGDDSPALNAEMATFVAGGGIVVAAAGNDGSPVPMYPAANPAAISVAAVDANRARAFFSNFGDTVDLSAPGSHVLSTCVAAFSNGENYCYYNGTSMASPVVAGVMAVILAARPGITKDEAQSAVWYNGQLSTSQEIVDQRIPDLAAAVAAVVAPGGPPTAPPTRTTKPPTATPSASPFPPGYVGPTAFPSITPQASWTPRPPASQTPTNVPASTPTARATDTPTARPTATATRTETLTATVTRTPTAVRSATPFQPSPLPATRVPTPTKAATVTMHSGCWAMVDTSGRTLRVYWRRTFMGWQYGACQ